VGSVVEYQGLRMTFDIFHQSKIKNRGKVLIFEFLNSHSDRIPLVLTFDCFFYIH